MIIGVTGTLSAGKGTVVDYLKEKGFKHYSVRQFLTEEVIRRGLPVNRESMLLVANDLRATKSPSYIAEKIYESAQMKGENFIIESLRNVGEVLFLRSKKGFYLIAVDADPELRYIRAVTRATETDRLSYQEFLDHEKKETSSDTQSDSNIAKCIELADFKLENNGRKEDLFQELEKIFEEILVKERAALELKTEPRPSWDEYFMDIVKAVSKRATCDRGRTGVIIVRDKQILVTGYVGSPKGLPHCDEVGHLLKKTVHEDGSETWHCVRTIHGEQNAICQAAKRGVSIDGATLYCKLAPCRVCAMMLINSGIKRVVCNKRYHGGTKISSEVEEMFKKAGVQFEVLHEETETYDKM